MKNFFDRLFGQQQKPRLEARPAAPARRDARRQEAAELYKKGDVIGGKYEIHGTLGKGGFGVVYLAYWARTLVRPRSALRKGLGTRESATGSGARTAERA